MSNTVLIKPVLTEKSLNKANVYAFEVNPQSTKPQIKQMVEATYKVEVSVVRTVVNKGKVKTVGKRRLKKQLPTVKKAYVTLSKGKIDDFMKK